MERFKRLDVFRQVPKDLTNPSNTGAVVSIVCVVVVAILFLTEFLKYMTVTTTSSMFVESLDFPLADEKLRIDVDIEVPRVPCAVLSLDVQDILGEHNVDVGGTLHKYRLGSNGKQLLDGAGRPRVSGTNMGDAATKEQIGEGCQLSGHLLVNKVPGNCHISAHAHPEMLNKMLGSSPMNLSHTINHLSFGSQLSLDDVDVAFTPLNGMVRTSTKSLGEIRHQGHSHSLAQCGSFEYYLKIVPTIYSDLRGDSVRSYQFTFSSNHMFSQAFPAIYFRYDFSPITVQFSETSEPFATFIVEVFAIIGGVFTGFSLVSSWLNLGVDKLIAKKQSIGKLG